MNSSPAEALIVYSGISYQVKTSQYMYHMLARKLALYCYSVLETDMDSSKVEATKRLRDNHNR